MDGMTLGQKIRELRLARQWTQKELAGDFITRNMLSQIENDGATPSMKTLEYLASKLEKPVGYFFENGNQNQPGVKLLEILLSLEAEENGEDAVKKVEEQLAINPEHKENKKIMQIYMGHLMTMGEDHLVESEYQSAKKCYERALIHGEALGPEFQGCLHKVYEQLSKVCIGLGQPEEVKDYQIRGRQVIAALIRRQEVQSLELDLLENRTDLVIKKAMKMEEVDEQADTVKVQEILGLAYAQEKKYKEAIEVLEKVIEQNEQKGPVNKEVYEKISQCYSATEDYKRAYVYLQKAGEVKKGK